MKDVQQHGSSHLGGGAAPSRPVPGQAGGNATGSGGPRAGAMGTTAHSSRIAGFAQMTARGRLAALLERGLITAEDLQTLASSGGLPLELAESFIENCVGGFTLPLGIATNFIIDGDEVFVPMAVEESSVVAAASHGAKLARSGGGFFSERTRCIATSQVQFQWDSARANDFGVSSDLESGSAEVWRLFASLKPQLLALASASHPRLIERGGGVHDIELRTLPKPGAYVLHIHVDTREAMGANIVNTIAEDIGRELPRLLPCQVGLKILTNLTVHRVTRVRCEVEPSALEMAGFSGADAVKRIVDAFEFADMDPFRAATHNKGVMNGIDSVVIATGNDWRAVEAGCHAYASLSGTYKPLTRWSVGPRGQLVGEIAVPVAVGTVGGVTKLHPAASSALRLMGNPPSERLSAIIASVGLAQNLSALRALACEGIQRGHMSLHEKNLEMLRRYDHIPAIVAVGGLQPATLPGAHSEP